MQQINRITPNMPATAYQTFSIASPPDTSVRAACEQVGCPNWRNGWQTAVDESTELGQQQAVFIRTRSGRTFREQRTGGGLTVFTFESGQRCFAEHRTRPELYAVRDGDWRGNPSGRVRQHSRAEDWVEDCNEQLGRLADAQARG